MGKNYYKEHSFGSGSRKVVLKVFDKREIRNIDSLVPYCDILVNGKPRGTMRVNARGNNKQTYKPRDLKAKARSFYVGNTYSNIDVIAHQSKKILERFI